MTNRVMCMRKKSLLVNAKEAKTSFLIKKEGDDTEDNRDEKDDLAKCKKRIIATCLNETSHLQRKQQCKLHVWAELENFY